MGWGSCIRPKIRSCNLVMQYLLVGFPTEQKLKANLYPFLFVIWTFKLPSFHGVQHSRLKKHVTVEICYLTYRAVLDHMCYGSDLTC